MSGIEFKQLEKPNSAITKQALGNKCIVGGCNAKPGDFCVDSISGKSLHETWKRYCHFARVLIDGDDE